MSLQTRVKAQYILFDFLGSALSWALFYTYRKTNFENSYDFKWSNIVEDEKFWLGTICIPFFWILLYGINGFYHEVLHRSRLYEFTRTLWLSTVGSVIIFFILLLDDQLSKDYTAYYQLFGALLFLQLFLVYVPKFFITSSLAHKIHDKKIGFPSLLIGSGKKAKKLFQELESAKRSAGYQFKGFLSLHPEKRSSEMSAHLPQLGSIEDMGNCIKEQKIQIVVLALDHNDKKIINTIISQLQAFPVQIKIIADLHDILTGQVKMNSIMHAALIEVDFDRIPYWQKFAKRLFDLLVSFTFLLVFSPLYLAISLLVKTGSKGPVLFKQERIGKNGEPFNIIKFRSMYTDAEKAGPQLSTDNDGRITPIGKFLRKTRLDEIPQFYNVVKGEMSIVGPRPERAFFIDQIVKRAPQYNYLYKIKPGITSWGQVKYGYAENVDEMIDRLNFDLIYLENRSLLVDLKIIIYTVMVIFQGKGK